MILSTWFCDFGAKMFAKCNSSVSKLTEYVVQNEEKEKEGNTV